MCDGTRKSDTAPIVRAEQNAAATDSGIQFGAPAWEHDRSGNAKSVKRRGGTPIFVPLDYQPIVGLRASPDKEIGVNLFDRKLDAKSPN
jgi:hypothetical protein